MKWVFEELKPHEHSKLTTRTVEGGLTEESLGHIHLCYLIQEPEGAWGDGNRGSKEKLEKLPY